MQHAATATSHKSTTRPHVRSSGFGLRAWCMVDGHVDVWILDSGFWIGFKSAAGEVCVVCLLACWRGVCCGCVVCARLMLRNSASASASRSVHSVHCISRNSYAIQRPPSTLAIKLYRTLICNLQYRISESGVMDKSQWLGVKWEAYKISNPRFSLVSLGVFRFRALFARASSMASSLPFFGLRESSAGRRGGSLLIS